MTAARRPGVLRGPRRFAAVRAWRAQRTVGVVRAAAAPNGLEIARLGLAIAGVRSAVTRNRLRRRLRAAVRDPLAAHAGMDLVLSAGTAAAAAPYAVLADDVTRAVDAVAGLVARRVGTPDDAVS